MSVLSCDDARDGGGELAVLEQGIYALDRLDWLRLGHYLLPAARLLQPESVCADSRGGARHVTSGE
jgi:hypothetical protein